jgi:DNA polymerase-4
MPRSIIHADMDAFYASVEQKDNPELKSKPVIVGGSVESRGVVCAASYEARRFGIHSAMPTARAKRLCPGGIFLAPRMDRYYEVSCQIRRIFEGFTPLVEPISLDEAFLDVTGSLRLFGTAVEIGRKIKAQVRSETGLTVSVGIAPNMFLAKLASGRCKPDGFLEIPEEKKIEFLDSLEVGDLWGVGEATAGLLRGWGIRTVEQLRSIPAATLRQKLGKTGDSLLELARGEDSREVVPDSEAKSIGSESTFPVDISDIEPLESAVLEHSEGVAARLRESGLQARTVTLKVKFADFTLTTRSETLQAPTDRTDLIASTATGLLRRHNRLRGGAVRLVGVSVSQLSAGSERQLALFGQKEDEKRRKLDKAVDRIRGKLGDDSIKRARLL